MSKPLDFSQNVAKCLTWAQTKKTPKSLKKQQNLISLKSATSWSTSMLLTKWPKRKKLLNVRKICFVKRWSFLIFTIKRRLKQTKGLKGLRTLTYRFLARFLCLSGWSSIFIIMRLWARFRIKMCIKYWFLRSFWLCLSWLRSV